MSRSALASDTDRATGRSGTAFAAGTETTEQRFTHCPRRLRPGHADARRRLLAVVVAVVEVGVAAGNARVVLVVAGARTVDVRVVALLVADVDIDVVAAIVVVVFRAVVVIGIAGIDGASARSGT